MKIRRQPSASSRKTVTVDAQNLDAQIELAALLFAGGQFDQFMAAAEMVLSAKANNVRGHAILGETWAATRDWSKAIDEFENAVQFDPHEIEY